MAAAAYLLLPISGLLAFLLGSSGRVRAHGLQAIVIGFAWPLLLVVASAVAAVVTQIVAVGGLVVWLLFMVLAGLGRDPRLPGIGHLLFEAVKHEPKEDLD